MTDLELVPHIEVIESLEEGGENAPIVNTAEYPYTTSPAMLAIIASDPDLRRQKLVVEGGQNA